MSGLQEYVRNHCRLAKEFQARVEQDARFRLMNDVKVVAKIFLTIQIFSNDLNISKATFY